jgi:hypothetical protein
MICHDDSDDDVLMVQDTDPGLPPHDHALSICAQSDSDAGFNIPVLTHMLISLSFSEHDYPNRFSKQDTSMICHDDSDDDVLMVQDTDPGLPPHAHTLSI